MSATGDRPAAVQRALGPRIPRPPRPRADSHRRQANRVPTSRILSIFPTSTGSKRATSTSPALLTTSSSRRPSWSHTGSRNPNSSPTRCLPTPTIPKIALWRQCFRRQCRRREPQGHDQSRPCPTKTEPNGRGGDPLPTGMGRQIDDHEPARSRYRPTPSAGIALGRPATSRPLTHCRGKRSTYDAGPWSRKITTQCCWPRTRPRCGRTTPSQLISADSHIPVTGPRQAWSLWQELRNTRWK